MHLFRASRPMRELVCVIGNAPLVPCTYGSIATTDRPGGYGSEVAFDQARCVTFAASRADPTPAAQGIDHLPYTVRLHPSMIEARQHEQRGWIYIQLRLRTRRSGLIWLAVDGRIESKRRPPRPRVALDRRGRRRLRRRRRGRDAAPGRLRRRDGVRARRAHRRRLAPQHLSRRRLRRPVAPVRVLVRPEPALVASLRAPGRDPGLPRGRRAAPRRPRPHPHGHRGEERALGRRAQQVDPETTRGRARGGRPAHRLRPALGAGRAADPGARQLRGPGVPHGAVAPRRRPRRQAGGGGGDRLQRDPGRAGDPADRRAGRRLPALAGVDLPEDGLRIQGADEAAVRALPGPPAARPRGDLRLHGVRRRRDDPAPLDAGPVPRGRPAADQQGDPGPGAARAR